jgi:hypothetical protein
MASMSQTVTTYQSSIQQPEKVRYIGTNHHYSGHVLLSPWANHHAFHAFQTVPMTQLCGIAGLLSSSSHMKKIQRCRSERTLVTLG